MSPGYPYRVGGAGRLTMLSIGSDGLQDEAALHWNPAP